jgi:hypothetical protein
MKRSTWEGSAFHAVRVLGFLALLVVAQQLFLLPNAFAWEIDHGDWYGPTVKGQNEGGSGEYSPGSSGGAGAFAGTQKVFLDFDTATTAGEHVYTLAQRDAILGGIASIYAPWDFTFSHTVVPTAPFATLIFNDGIPGGLASDVEFRNIDLSGSATINVCGILGGCPATPPASVVGLSTTIGAHELGHLVGLRHADSMGPIGFGLPTILAAPYGAKPVSYLPDYPGPTAALETRVHTMASPASVGQTVAEAIAPTVMGERSAVKLEFNEVGLVSPEVGIAHGTPATAQMLTLPTFPVPNTAVPGDLRYGMSLSADAEVVTGSLSLPFEKDVYKFVGTAGDVINAEVISLVPARFGVTDIDALVELIMPDGVTFVAQGAGIAVNDDEFESFDATLIDIVLPVTGAYFVRVGATPFFPGDTGDYELFLYRFNARPVPEPGVLTLLVFGALFAVGSVRRRSSSTEV